MKVYLFQCSPPDVLYGYSVERPGANLPADRGPWTYWKELDMEPGRLGVGIPVEEVLDGLEARGWHLTTPQPAVRVTAVNKPS